MSNPVGKTPAQPSPHAVKETKESKLPKTTTTPTASKAAAATASVSTATTSTTTTASASSAAVATSDHSGVGAAAGASSAGGESTSSKSLHHFGIQDDVLKPSQMSQITKHKYYPEVPRECYLSHHISLRGEGNRSLLETLKDNYSQPEFQRDMGLQRNPKCTSCTKKAPCTVLTVGQINDILLSQFDPISNKELKINKDDAMFCACPSCGIKLTMWDKQYDYQPISTWQLCVFTATECKTYQLERRDIRIYCRGCAAIAEACYYDLNIMNYFRNQLFWMMGSQSYGYHFPKLERIDEKNRCVVTGTYPVFGNKSDINTQWLKQEGFATYKLPPNLMNEIIKYDPTYLDKIREASHRNEHTSSSIYYGDGDPDIKTTSRVTRVSKVAAGEPVARRARSSYHSSVIAAKHDLPKPAKKASTSGIVVSSPDEALGPAAAAVSGIGTKEGEEGSSSSSSLSSASSASSSSSKKGATKKAPTVDVYSQDLEYIVFKIPIDPRKNSKKNSLSSIVLDHINKTLELKPGNCLFTTKLLATLAERFEYEDFLRWGIDHFRLVVPLFTPRKSSNSQEMRYTQEDWKTIQQISDISARHKALQYKITELKHEAKRHEEEKDKLFQQVRSKTLGLIDSPQDMKLLGNYSLIPTVVERKGERLSLNKSYIEMHLPQLLAIHGFELRVQDGKRLNLNAPVAALINELFDNARSVAKKSNFTLKYIDREMEEAIKANRKRMKEGEEPLPLPISKIKVDFVSVPPPAATTTAATTATATTPATTASSSSTSSSSISSAPRRQ